MSDEYEGVIFQPDDCPCNACNFGPHCGGRDCDYAPDYYYD